MLSLMRDLIAHKGHANAALLTAVRQNDAASSDLELRDLLHHIVVANRFWLLSCLAQPFVAEAETQVPASLDALILNYRTTHEREQAFLAGASEADLARILQNSLIPGGRCSVSQALMQVCMHSHGHRAQCAKLLRQLGGSPPPTDFILWLTDRSQPEWPPIGEVV